MIQLECEEQVCVQLVPSRATLKSHLIQDNSNSILFSSPEIEKCKAVVSWMSAPESYADKQFVEVDGLSRFNFGSSVAFVGVLTANELCFPMLWDAFHALPVGGEIVIVDYVVNAHNCILYRDYFKDSVEIETVGNSPTVVVFRKTALTLAETNKGLGDWSFCIPISHPNGTTLAEIRSQIEGLGLAKYELLICSSPHYKDLISEHATFVQEPDNGTLSAKKNTLAAAAQYGNLCIFHDRVSLPKNFKSAVEKYGDYYGLAHFQSLIFDPTINRIIRYSDYHVNLSTNATFFGETDNDLHLEKTFAKDSTLFREWNSEFSIANPRLYTPQMYGTGTLYICKKAVWEFCGQAPEIDWNDLEDLEHGHRSISKGVPSRVNPHAFTRSRRVRSIMLGSQRHQLSDWSNQNLGGSQIISRDASATKQLFSVDPTRVRKELYAFIDDFIPSASRRPAYKAVSASALNTGLSLFEVSIQILDLVPVLREPGFVKTLIARFFDCFPFGAHDDSSVRRLAMEVVGGGYHVDIIAGSPEFRRLADLCETGIFIDTGIKDNLADAILRTWADKQTPLAFDGSYEEFSKAIMAAF